MFIKRRSVKTHYVNIQIASHDGEVGLAPMLKDLLTQNLEQNPHKLKDFCKMNIAIGLMVSDADIRLTMDFAEGALILYSSIKDTIDMLITAPTDIIMSLSNVKLKWGLPYYFDETGKEILSAMKTGRLKMKGVLFHIPSLIRLSRIMSVHP
jgi:hypothetical protein